MDDRPDSELVAAARRGERDAFTALVDRHYPRTRAVARALAGDDGDDVAQEAVLQAFLGLGLLREPARFGAWLAGIAANLARVRLRRRRLQQSLGTRLSPARPIEEPDTGETAALVRDALAALPAAQRDAVLMHDVAGYTSDEIAARVGGSAGAVRVRLHRGRRERRRRLAPLAPAHSRRENTMIQVELRDVIVRVAEDGEPPELVHESRIVLLGERGGPRVLPIWVGAPEGDALALHLGSEPIPRPLTVDLMARLLEAAGARVEQVVVSSLRENTFYAVVRIAAGGGEASQVDARPSDAINLAVRVDAPIFVDAAVFAGSALAGADRENLDTELRRVAERITGESLDPLPGEWRSLSPELVRSWGTWPRPLRESRGPA